MFGLGAPELFLIFLIALLVFGAGKLPQIGDALGRGIKNFKRSANGDTEIEVNDRAALKTDDKKRLKHESNPEDAEVMAHREAPEPARTKDA